MKKLFSLMAIAVSMLLLNNSNSYGQAHLKITRIINFPDTAYEGIHYDSMHIVIKNIGTATYLGNLDVFLYSVQRGISVYDTLRLNPFNVPPIPVNDSITISQDPHNYYFRTVH